MQTTESCTLCEKIAVTLEAKQPIGDLSEIPTTFDPNSRTYTWVQHDFLSYAVVPRTVHGTTARVDMFFCVDEDDLDDVNLVECAERLLHERVLLQWNIFKNASFVQSGCSSSADLPCRKLRHDVLGGMDA